MRWFKHMCCSARDPKMVQLIAKHGAAGYGMYWMLIENIAEQVDDRGITDLTYPAKHWAKILGTYQGKHASIFLQSLANLSLISLDMDGDLLRVDMPNILKYRDEWTKRKSKTPERLRSKESDTDIEEEIKKEYPQTPTSRGLETGQVENFAEAEPTTQTQAEAQANVPEIDFGNMPTNSPAATVPSSQKSSKPGRKPKAPNPAGGYTEGFELFWQAYPRKTGKDYAFACWKKAKVRHPDITTGLLVRAIKAQVEAGNFSGHDGTDFTPHPSTWLNQGRWQDEIKSQAPTNGGYRRDGPPEARGIPEGYHEVDPFEEFLKPYENKAS